MFRSMSPHQSWRSMFSTSHFLPCNGYFLLVFISFEHLTIQLCLLLMPTFLVPWGHIICPRIYLSLELRHSFPIIKQKRYVFMHQRRPDTKENTQQECECEASSCSASQVVRRNSDTPTPSQTPPTRTI
jgi:hypothetical protein